MLAWKYSRVKNSFRPVLSIQVYGGLCQGCQKGVGYSTIREIDATSGPCKYDKQLRSQEVQGWMQQSLNDSKSSQLAQLTGTYVVSKRNELPKIVSDEKWALEWEKRFRTGDLKCVTDVIQIRKVHGIIFSFTQMMVLISALENLERYYDIDRLYQAYEKDWETAGTIISDQELYLKYLQLMLKTNNVLRKYEKAENFFKKYIKQSDLDSYFIDIGLRALLENKNYITARQFFQYMLDNQEVFPITEDSLQILLSYISQNDDLSTLKAVFEDWILKYPQPVSNNTLSLIHKQFLKFDREYCNRYWDLLLGHSKLTNSGYKNSTRYHILVTMYLLKFHKLEFDKVDALLSSLEYDLEEKSFLYSQLLLHFEEQKDLAGLTRVISKMKQEKDIGLTKSDHSIILKYFVKTGSLQHFLGYLKELKSTGNLQFDQLLFVQIWECAFQSYPTLRPVLENEFRILFNNKWYKRTFPWLTYSIASQIHRPGSDVSGDDTFVRRIAERADDKFLKRIERALEHGRYRRAKSIIIDQTRLGIRPNFQFFYSLMKFCVNNGYFSMCNILKDTLKSTYRFIPLKVEILEMRMNLYKLADRIRKTSDNNITIRKESLRVIKEFIETNQERLNFQNYLQLATLSSRYKGKTLCNQLLEKCISMRNTNDRRETYLLYRSLLLFFVRINEPEKYLFTLKQMQSEENLIMSKNWLNNIKSNIKYFSKHGHDDKRPEMVQEFNKLREKYAYQKIEGLESVHDLITFLKKWLDHEVYKKQLSLYQRQLQIESKSDLKRSDSVSS